MQRTFIILPEFDKNWKSMAFLMKICAVWKT